MESSSSSFNYEEKVIDDLFPDIDFSKTRQYAQRNIKINGVNSLLAEVNANEAAYLSRKRDLIEQNVESLNNARVAREQVADREWHFALLGVAGVVGFIILSILTIALGLKSRVPQTIFNLLFYATYAAIIIGLIGFFFTPGGSRRYEYDSLVSSLKEDAASIANTCSNTNKTLYAKVDSLYLSSLDPAHREIVLMRRDQERQHREALQVQREHNKAIEREQHLRRMAEEENAKATKELLDIEKERERRMNGW